MEHDVDMRYYYVGNCVNMFDENGACVTMHFADASDCMCVVENAKEVSEEEFADVVSCDVLTLPLSDYVLSINEDRGMAVAWDLETDIHYFFEEGP